MFTSVIEIKHEAFMLNNSLGKTEAVIKLFARKCFCMTCDNIMLTRCIRNYLGVYDWISVLSCDDIEMYMISFCIR